MGALNLTIQVQNIDPTVTTAELETYFSYCGTVDKIRLQRNKDESQSAQVTFRQPFAFRTALLLDNAIIGRQPIRVLPSEDSTKDLPSIKLEGDTKVSLNVAPALSYGIMPGQLVLHRIGDEFLLQFFELGDQEQARLVPVVLRPNEAVTPGGTTNILDRTRDMLEERYKLSEKGRVVVDQTRSAIHTAEKAAECFRSLLASNPYVAAGLVFLSGALYKAAMYASQVSARKRN